ncbi:MAG: hypothetical protein IJ501_06070 [Bacilli bacterium]|nr:hypothetical protein [Bacilli bacterium]
MEKDFLELIRAYNIINFINSEYFEELMNFDKIDCYFDCDGVLFDTIKVSFNEMSLDYKNIPTDPNIQAWISEYYKKVDWTDLLNRGGEINEACKKLIFLKNLNIFKNMAVATHRHSYLNEGVSKKQVFNERAKGITVFDIPHKIPKEVALNSIGNILVDDSKSKITSWVNSGGIGVLFKDSVNELILPTLETPYFITSEILDVIKVTFILKYFEKISDLNKEKSLTKNR